MAKAKGTAKAEAKKEAKTEAKEAPQTEAKDETMLDVKVESAEEVSNEPKDEKLEQLAINLQSQIRSFCQLAELKRKRNQQKALVVLQKNIRSWNKLRTWGWFQVYGRVKPMLKSGKMQEELENLQHKMSELEVILEEEDEHRRQVEESLTKAKEEKEKLLAQLEFAKSGAATVEERLHKLVTTKADLERNLNDVHQRLTQQEEKTAEMERTKKKAEK
ncbi:unnamed protein product, partial [Toxocara canis]|uniref:Myosin_tail_1 domain-containing protein n=1 Tax=Toxocara canis TaxID=6265 RepID=A0A183U8I7_TOXCA